MQNKYNNIYDASNIPCFDRTYYWHKIENYQTYIKKQLFYKLYDETEHNIMLKIKFYTSYAMNKFILKLEK